MTLLEAGAFDWLRPTGFQHPDRAWYLMLIPLAVLVYWLAQRARKRRSIRYTNTAVLERLLPRQRTWLRHLAVACSLLSLVTLTLAYMIPFANDRVPRQRATVVLVLDVSRSMGASDVSPTRFEAAKKAAIDFVDGMPDGYNVSVIAMSGNPAMKTRPTKDHGAVRRIIEGLEMADSTAIGEALLLAKSAVGQAPKADDGSVAPASVVLLSDGTQTAGRSARQGAAALKQDKIPLYTVSYGTDRGYVNLDGKREPVVPDRALMTELASLAGGESFDARSAEGLIKAYESLDKKVGYDVVPQEVTARWAGLGLVFGFLAAVAAAMMAARWPS